MQDKLNDLWNTRPLIIGGPCSAETEAQVLETARQLAADGRVHLFRAGIWKPRTRPGTFEGVGEAGLSWLKRVKQETGLPVTVEVAKTSHIEKALQNEVDVLWVGARTTVNPFSVQELADALRGVDVPVFIKNPVNADIDLWIGAVERFLKTGITRLGIIHRGFSSYSKSDYRNSPMWQIPIEMKRRYPDMLLICDPSHICGNRHMLQQVAQKSINLGFGGLMLESHINPDSAWSDAAQQITPAAFTSLMDTLIWRVEELNDYSFLSELSELRDQIDEIDDELISLLSRRMQIVDGIGLYKKENNMTILQTKRFNEILLRALEKGVDLGLTKEFINRYFNAIHLESINRQNKVLNSDAAVLNNMGTNSSKES